MDIARLGFDIDSGPAKSAARALLDLDRAAAQADGAAAKLETRFRRANGQFQSTSEYVKDHKDELKALAREFNSTMAAQLDFAEAQSRLAQAIRMGVVPMDQAQVAMEALQRQYFASGDAAQHFGRSANAANMQVGNMFAQLNDIGVMAASGQNPILTAIQQGTQINQMWADMGAQGRSVAGVTGLLRGAFASMISPMSLLTIGVIAAGSALVQWGINAATAGEETVTLKDAVDTLSSSVSTANEMASLYSQGGLDEMRAKYGEITAEIYKMIEGQREYAFAVAMQDAGKAIRALGGEYNALNGQVELFAKTGRGDMAALMDQLGLSKDQVVLLGRAYKDALNAKTPEEMANALGRINSVLDRSKVRMKEVHGNTLAAEGEMRQLAKAADDVNSSSMSGIVSEIGRVTAAAAAASAMLARLTAGDDERGSQRETVRGANTRMPDQPWLNAGTGGGGGGGGGSDPYAQNLQSLIESLRTEQEVVDAWYAEQQAILNDRRAVEILGEQAHKEALLDLEREYLQRKKDLNDGYAQFSLGAAGELFGELYSLSGSKYDGLLKLQKSFAAASALVNTYTAAAQTLADPALPFFAKFAAVAKVVAAGMGLVNAIKGGGAAASAGAGGGSATAPQPAQPERVTRIELLGDDWLTALVRDKIGPALYEYTKDGGRVMFA